MELLQGEAFFDLFRHFEQTAFHLEVNDAYDTPEESGPFQRFLAGEPDDFAWHRPWLQLIGEATAAGRRVERVRVISVPHVPYTRWGLSVAPLNIAAGEDIRWLPRHHTDDITLTGDDFWLIDDRLLVFTVFEPSGRWAGGTATTDPHLLDYARSVRDAVWDRAIPHHHYLTQPAL